MAEALDGIPQRFIGALLAGGLEFPQAEPFGFENDHGQVWDRMRE